MSGLVVRFARRKAAWEAADAAEIREIEFKDKDGKYDFRPSVYEVAEEQLVRAFAEHAAAAPIDPPGSALGIDLSGVRFKVEPQFGSDTFSFTRNRHREIVLSSRSDLDEVIELACRELESRRRDVAKTPRNGSKSSQRSARWQRSNELVEPRTRTRLRERRYERVYSWRWSNRNGAARHGPRAAALSLELPPT